MCWEKSRNLINTLRFFFFWRGKNGIYIHTERDASLAQDVPKRALRNKDPVETNTKTDSQPIPRQAKGSDHHCWQPKTKVASLAFNHRYEWNLTFSMSFTLGVWKLSKRLLLRSFHNSQTESNQSNWRKDRRALFMFFILLFFREFFILLMSHK